MLKWRTDKHGLSVRIAAAIIALLACGCFCACSRTDQKPAAPPEKITIACAALPETALAQIAQSLGYYRDEGLETTTHLHPYGKIALKEVLEGRADIATVAETPVMFAVMKGAQISIIAIIQTSNSGHAILARSDRGIHTFKNLKGKKIAATLGTTSQFFLDTMLATQGISGKDVEVIDMKAEEIPAALANGDIDAVSAFNPYVAFTQKKLGSRVITFTDRDIYRYTFTVVATQEFIRKNPEKIRKILRALVRAEEFVKQNPGEAQRTVAGFSGIDTGMIRDTWDDSRFSVLLDQSLLLALDDESLWAIKRKLTEAKKVPNYLDFIYLDGLKAVRPEAVQVLR